MRHSASPPTCPQCGSVVYQTHTCRRSALAPTPAPALVAAPSTFREDVRAARRQARVTQACLDLGLDRLTADARVRDADRAWSEDVGL